MRMADRGRQCLLTECRHRDLNDRVGRKAERPLSGCSSATLLWHAKLYISPRFQTIVILQLRYDILDSAPATRIHKNADAIAAKAAC